MTLNYIQNSTSVLYIFLITLNKENSAIRYMPKAYNWDN